MIKDLNKVLVIGLDGASFKVLEQAFKLGYAPHLYEFIQKGFKRELKSPLPAESPISWPVIFTGLNPGKTGLFGWHDYSNPFRIRLETSQKIVGKAIWDILSTYGSKSIIVNVPMTYPPYRINGIMISGFPCPTNNLIAFPPNEEKKLRKHFPEYRVEPSKITVEYSKVDEGLLLKDVINLTKIRTELCLYLMENYPWDFFFVVFTELDRLQHLFYEDDLQRSHGRLLLCYLRFLDSCLTKITSKVDENTTVIILSDHGFERVEKYIAINKFLEKIGFLKRQFKHLPLQDWFIFNLLRKANIPMTYQIALKILFRVPIINSLRKQPVKLNEVKAYCPDLGYIYLKEKQVINEILEKLYKLYDPETGKPIIKNIYRKEELFHGPYLENAPDLLVIPEEGYEARSDGPSLIFSKNLITPSKRGTHYGYASQLGIFILYPSMKEIDQDIDIIKAEDVCPTILSLFNLPIPSYLDGISIIKKSSHISIPNHDFTTKLKMRSKIQRIKERMRKSNIE